jgi:hypothetical protein
MGVSDVLHIRYENISRRGSRGNNFFIRKWLIINEEVAYKRMINYTNAVGLRNIGKYLYKA